MKMPRSEDRGTIAGRATIAGPMWRFRAKHALGLDPGVETGSREENASNQGSGQVADGAAGWNTSAKPSMQ